MANKHLDDQEMCAMRFVMLMGGYERNLHRIACDFEELRVRMEGVGAIDYSHDGSRPEYHDSKPAIMDRQAAIIEELQASVALRHREYMQALDLFLSNPCSEVVWLKWGRRMGWRAVAAEMGYSVRATMRRERPGLRYIYAHMPKEHRQR